jgi:hypothetical protein
MRRLGTLCFALLVMALAASIARAEAPAPADATPALDAVTLKDGTVIYGQGPWHDRGRTAHQNQFRADRR